MIKRTLLGLALLMPLGAWSCTTAEAPTNSRALQSIYALQVANTTADTAILAYDELALCAPVAPVSPCSDPKVVASLGKAEDSAEKVLDAAEKVIRANPALDATALIAGAQAALDVVKQILTSYNIPGG